MRCRVFAGWWLVAAVGATTACNAPMVLTQQVEARRLATQLQLQFTKAADAANRSVMTDSDDDATAAAHEAQRGAEAVLADVEQLEKVLTSMGYSEELRFLKTFGDYFAKYQKLDAEILPLAVENTNLKAQRLSFGPSTDAANAFRTSVEAASKTARPGDAWRAEALAGRAVAAVLEMQALQAPHIAEADDASMDRIEQKMIAADRSARKALEQMKTLFPPEFGGYVTAATAALDKFKTINMEIVSLSRRNSDVRSLALTLGRKRELTAQCDDQLRGLLDALSRHEMKATR